MVALNKKSEDGGVVVTANPFDGLFKASLIDTQTGNKGGTRKLVEMIYLCVDECAVSITKNGKEFTAAQVKALDQFNADDAAELYKLGRLIEEAIIPSEDDVKK